MCNTCDHIVDVDLETGTFEILAISERFNNYEMPTIADYQESLESVCRNHIKEVYQPAFLDKFSLSAMKNAFREGVANISLEYELQAVRDVPVWKERTAFCIKLKMALNIFSFMSGTLQKRNWKKRVEKKKKTILFWRFKAITRKYFISIWTRD